MARKLRVIADETYFHVTQRGNNKNVIFHDVDDYAHYYSLLKRYFKKYGSLLYHYCLMPNHVHMLLKVIKAEDLSMLMKCINQTYTCHYKKRYDFTGALWQGRYGSLPIDNDEYFLECARYIERNPLVAKLVKNLTDYKFNSFRHYATNQRSDLLSKNMFYDGLGKTDAEKMSRYRDYILEDRG